MLQVIQPGQSYTLLLLRQTCSQTHLNVLLPSPYINQQAQIQFTDLNQQMPSNIF